MASKIRKSLFDISFLKVVISIAVVLSLLNCNSISIDKPSKDRVNIEIPDFFGSDTPKPQVLLLGVFHFQDAGADLYKPKYSVNIMSQKRQDELEYLIRALEKYEPTKIVVEVKQNEQQLLDSLYHEYLNDRFELKSKEVFQIGFKLGKRLGLSGLISGDVRGKEYDYIISDFTEFKKRRDEIMREEELTESLKNDYTASYINFYSYMDSLKTTMTIADYLMLINSDHILNIKHGDYFINEKYGNIGVNNGREYPTADNISGWWYNRNLRIVSNIRKAIRSNNDRVLVVFGSGHIPIIKHALEANPEIKLVSLSDVMNPSSD